MKSSAPLLALACVLSITATTTWAGETKPAILEVAPEAEADDVWDDSDSTATLVSDDPLAPPTQSLSPSDAEVVPPGATQKNYTRQSPGVRLSPRVAPKSALDEAYEGIIDETVGLVVSPNSRLLLRNCGSLPAPWAHRSSVFGEYLFLRPRSTDLSYSTPIATVPISPTETVNLPAGRVGNLDPNYSSGFRVGVNRAIDEFASIRGTYTNYQNSTRDSIIPAPGDALVSLVSYGPIMPAGTTFSAAQAASSLKYQFADVELRKIVSYSQFHAINYSVGARYVHLSGGLDVQQAGSIRLGDAVAAKSNFDGGGIRFGLDGEHYAKRTGLLAYWRTGASFIGGQFREDYTENYNQTTNPLTVNSHWNGGRLVTILDAEIGVGWSSKSQRARVRAGYLVNGWFNTIGPGSYVGAVQSGNFDHMAKAFSLDGLTASAEYRF